jgi:hypothetical protein
MRAQPLSCAALCCTRSERLVAQRLLREAAGAHRLTEETSSATVYRNPEIRRWREENADDRSGSVAACKILGLTVSFV